MSVENWPGRGFYRGNKQKMVKDAMRFGDSRIATPMVRTEEIVAMMATVTLDPPHIAATEHGDPKAMGYTGNACQNEDCGSTRMVISGHCEVCLDCGTSSGCS